MDTNSLTYRTLKNISYRFTAYLWPIIFSILITPIIVFRLGVKDYGIYIFITTVLGLLNLLDMGVSTAVTKFLAEYQGRDDLTRVKKLIFSANSLFLLAGLAGFAITASLAIIGHFFFPNRIINEQYYLILFLLAGINFLTTSVNMLYTVIPEALQRFDISSKINIVYLTLSALANLILVLLGYKLIAIFLAQLILTLIFAVVRRYYALLILPEARYRFAWDKEEIKKCYRFGLALVANSTASISLASLDRLIIPIFVGPAQLSYYSLPGNVAARIPGVTDNLVGVIFPATAHLSGAGDHERIQRFYIRSVRLIVIIASAITFSIIFLAYKILQYWLSTDFALASSGILVILALTNFVISILSPVTGFFFGLGKVKFSSYLSLVMAALNALLLFILLPRYGIYGAAWAYLISVLPIFYMFYFIENKHLKLTGRGRYYLRFSGQIMTTTAIFFLVVKFLISPWIVNLFTLAIGGPLAVIVFLAIYNFLGFNAPEDRDDLQKFTKHLILKFSGKNRS